MKRYDITITIDTVAKHTAHVLNRVKKALREYGIRGDFGNRMRVIDLECQQVKPPQVEVSVGARFLMDGIFYLLAQVGTAQFSLVNMGTGQRWTSPRYNVQAVLDMMQDDNNEWELAEEGETKNVTNVCDLMRGMWNQEESRDCRDCGSGCRLDTANRGQACRWDGGK